MTHNAHHSYLFKATRGPMLHCACCGQLKEIMMTTASVLAVAGPFVVPCLRGQASSGSMSVFC